MTDEELALRVMGNPKIYRQSLVPEQVIAVLRTLADFTLWCQAFSPPNSVDDGPAVQACRFMHRVADAIEEANRD